MAAAKDTGAGLELLQHLAVVKIHRKFTVRKYKYMVNTDDDELLFTVEKKNTYSFHIDAVDSQERQAFMIRRPTVFPSVKVEVTMGGQVVSKVREKNTFVTPLYSINDRNDVPVLRVKGDCHGREYKTQDKTNIGSISKKYHGLMDEIFGSVADYDITFPVDLDLRYKVATIATCILIDCSYHAI